MNREQRSLSNRLSEQISSDVLLSGLIPTKGVFMSLQGTSKVERKFPLDNPSDQGTNDRISSGETEEIDESSLIPEEIKERHKNEKTDDRHIAPTL
jgi:hypothetical protein